MGAGARDGYAGRPPAAGGPLGARGRETVGAGARAGMPICAAAAAVTAPAALA